MIINTLFGEENYIKETKKCEDCLIEYPLNGDYFRSYGTGGRAFRAKCRSCERTHNKAAAKLKKYAPSYVGVCMCCNKEMKLVMDHDHQTNAIRGMLCRNCNTGIGWLGDDPIGVLMAIRYFIKNNCITKTEAVDWIRKNG